ncbi:MAG TPA: sulfite oxidase [Chloroflexota bacterium]|jgi:DMSO/TMAO reductase YedYZ molybdopterin-dependent catalytic subunit
MTPDQTTTPAFTADPRLVVVTPAPFNAETPLPEQLGVITPTPLFYVRSHFAVPQINVDEWRLSLEGEFARPMQLSYGDLRALPSRTLLSTLECAGNGRSGLEPQADGEPWNYGAASTAEWTGVALAEVLKAAGLQEGATELVIDGADQGHVAAAGRVVRYARSMAPAQALHPDTLLVYAMNGELLRPEHGFPVRLLVAGWYGMAAVKWVTRITATTQPFQGFYQVDRYVMAHPERGEATTAPLEAMRVRSLITDPQPGASLARGPQRIQGVAWSGAAAVGRVEVSVDGGQQWQPAELTSAAERYAWRRWEYLWQPHASGYHELRSRAFDDAGNSQPAEPEWNQLGYANNAIQVVTVTVSD